MIPESPDGVKELVVIGAGPHGHALLLRLLEPDADFLSDKERHFRAQNTKRQRPRKDVIHHVKKLSRGPRAILRTSKKSRRKEAKCSKGAAADPPPLKLADAQNHVLVVDAHGGWMRSWEGNFKSLRIENLRSLMNAHNDPFDHRTLEVFAEAKGRGDELVTLTSLRQRDQNFRGPYQVPSTQIFNHFHEVLSRAYGIEDAVCTGTVQSISPTLQSERDDEPIFEVGIAFGKQNSLIAPDNVSTIKTRRLVCAMGPMFRAMQTHWGWEASLRKELSVDQHFALRRILHAHQIMPFLVTRLQQQPTVSTGAAEPIERVLIVGGGITSAQLTLLAAKAQWCNEVVLIKRSKIRPRHFDIPNEWMGPQRGKLLDEFWSLNMEGRARQLREARGGGTIPPMIIDEILGFSSAQIKEEAEISEVHWAGGRFHVVLDDGSECQPCDMIWLATGAQNHIDHYQALSHLREVLPVDVVNGLPVLNRDLSWRAPEGGDAEPAWKQVARGRIWCMGALAALELGPDALNLIGARQGSVRVAKAIRHDFNNQPKRNGSHNGGQDEDCGCC